MAVYHTYAGCQVGNGGETEHGRPDRNTNTRKLSERKGSGGTAAQNDMKTSELATRSTAQAEKIERRSTAGAARQVWVQRAAHSKRVAPRKPTQKILQVKSGVMFVLL